MSYSPENVNSDFDGTEKVLKMEEIKKETKKDSEKDSEKDDRDKDSEIDDRDKDSEIDDRDKDSEMDDRDKDSELEDTYKDSDILIQNEDEHELVKKRNTKGFIFDLIFYVILVFVCIYVIPNYVVQRTVVDGTSMENTLHDKDQLYVEKISYHFDALKRFDIIVFYPYGRKVGDYYVKRIIGLPGETVQIIGSDIYINGKILKEKYGKDPITDSGRAAEPITLRDDEYFVLGDNRSISKDSRTEDVGNVKRKNIGGRVILRIKPLIRFGTVD